MSVQFDGAKQVGKRPLSKSLYSSSNTRPTAIGKKKVKKRHPALVQKKKKMLSTIHHRTQVDGSYD